MALSLYKGQAISRLLLYSVKSIIRLNGHAWELIGAIRRAVKEDGVEYPWEEYLWRNPYVGYRWMIHSDGHFSWGRPCSVLPRREGQSLGYSDLS